MKVGNKGMFKHEVWWMLSFILIIPFVGILVSMFLPALSKKAGVAADVISVLLITGIGVLAIVLIVLRIRKRL